MSDQTPRANLRIDEEWQRLRDKSAQSGFWSVGEPESGPDAENGDTCFEVGIRGRCIAHAGPALDRVTFSKQQVIRVTLPFDFPIHPPSLKIESGFFHPNLPADGMIAMHDIGLTWSDDVTLDMIVERIWNTLRAVRVDTLNAIQIGAGQWYREKAAAEPDFFPIDPRPLFQQICNSQNVVRYCRKGQDYPKLSNVEPFVIDERNAKDLPPSDSPIHFIE